MTLGAATRVINSEYSNAADLLTDSEFGSQLMGILNGLDPIARQQAISKITSKPVASQGSRAEFEKFFKEFPDNIKTGLLDGSLRLADHIIYSIKPVNGSKTVKMFETQDMKEVGLRNISNGRLPKNSAFLLSGIYLLQGIAATTGVDDVKSTVYDEIDAKATFMTGECTLKANKKQIISDLSLRAFCTEGLNLVPKGYYKLANPRPIADDVDIEFDIDLGTVTGVDAKAYLFLGLQGTITIP
jgi:hypothetical protein